MPYGSQKAFRNNPLYSTGMKRTTNIGISTLGFLSAAPRSLINTDKDFILVLSL
ncbi:hypothetical protein D3C80_1829410 [compost metagenome]